MHGAKNRVELCAVAVKQFWYATSRSHPPAAVLSGRTKSNTCENVSEVGTPPKVVVFGTKGQSVMTAPQFLEVAEHVEVVMLAPRHPILPAGDRKTTSSGCATVTWVNVPAGS